MNFLQGIFLTITNSLYYFWNPRKKIQKWFNRGLIIVITIFALFAVNTNRQINNDRQRIQNERNFDDKKIKNNNKKIKKIKKNLNEKIKEDPNYLETEKGSAENFEITKREQAQDLNTTEAPVVDRIIRGALDGLSKDGQTSKDKQLIKKLVFLKAGQLKYYYEHELAKSFNLKNVHIGFDIYSGSLFIGEGVPLELQKPIQERAKDLFNSSELSSLIDKINIKFVSNNEG